MALVQANFQQPINMPGLISSKRTSGKVSTLGEETQRFEMLYTRLRTKRVIKHTTQMLQLLLSLSGDGKSAMSPQSSSIINSVFANKMMNKVDYTTSALR